MRHWLGLALLLVSLEGACGINVMESLYLKDAPQADSEEQEAFSMTGELGLLLAGGNSEGSTLTGKLNASQNLKNWLNRYTANFLYKKNTRDVDGEQTSVASAQKFFISGQSDYKLEEPSNRLFMYAEYEKDRFNQYDYQAAMAMGWSSQVWEDEQGGFRYSVGPGYAMSRLEEQETGEDQVGLIIRASMEYQKKLNDKATFRQFISTETDKEFSRSVSETSLAAKINGSLAMKLSLNMIHNRSPNSLGKSLDTETAITLVYQFF